MALDFADFWRIVWRKKLLLVLAAALGGAGALAVSKALPVYYTSEALLEVESQTPLVRDLNPANAVTLPDQVRTQADILQSRALADTVVRDLDLAGNPAFKAAPRDPTWMDLIQRWARGGLSYLQGETPSDPVTRAVELFGRRLQVSANEKSHIVEVRFTSGSPTLSADVTNDLLKRYMGQEVASDLQVSTAENQWLTEHLAALQNEVRDAEQKAQAFRDANRLMDVQAGALPTVQLNEQEHNLSAARQDLARAQAAYETATKSAGRDGNFAGQEALSSQLIQLLREREAETAQRLANLRQRYGEGHPVLAATQAELGSIRQHIADESSKIVASLRRDVAVAADRVASLQRMVAESQGEARQSVSAAATLAQLNQEVEAKRHVYTAFLTRMEQTQLASTQFPAARVVSPAVPPERADGLPAPVTALLGALAGLFLGAAAILLRQVAGGRISSAKEMATLTGTESIGSVPALPGTLTPMPMRILDMAQEGMVETLRALRYAVQARNPEIACHRVLVSSSVPGEGKSTLAASLARLSAADGLRVLLVEADLRRPHLGDLLRASPIHSLEDLLNGTTALPDTVHIDEKSGLHSLLADGSSSNPQRLLQSAAFSAILQQAQHVYDLVVIDSPPVMRVIDAAILSVHSDIILFAVAWSRTPRAVVGEALRRFPRHMQSRIATVITRVPKQEIGDLGYGYYEGYSRRVSVSA